MEQGKSKSGYAKNELYEEIVKSLENDDYTKVLYVLVELISSRNELQKVLAFILDMYLGGLWSNSLQRNKLIINSLQQVLLVPKRNILRNLSFQTSFLLFSMASFCYTSIDKKGFYDKTRIMQKDRLDRAIEGILINADTIGESSVVAKYVKHHTSLDIYRLLNAFCYYMKHCKKSECEVIVMYLLTNKDIKFDELPEEISEFNDVKIEYRHYVPMWLWLVILKWLEKQKRKSKTPSAHYLWETAKTTFNLYKSFFTIRSANERNNIIYRLIDSICTKFAIDPDIGDYCSNLELKANEATIIFEEINGPPPNIKANNRTHFKRKPKGGPSGAKSNNTEQNETTQNESHRHSEAIKKPPPCLDYLKCVVYKDNL